MADRWIITKRKFHEHYRLEQARTELRRLQEKYPETTFHLVRIKTHVNEANHSAVIDLARDIVVLWGNPKIQALDRSERNAAIEETRTKLIEAVHAYDGLVVGEAVTEAA